MGLDAGERHLAPGGQRLRLVREPEQLVEIGPLLAILNTGVRNGADSGAPTPDWPMAMLGLFVGGPLAFLAGILNLLGAGDRQSGLLVLLTIPEIVWEAFIAIYCTWKGFRPSPVLEPIGKQSHRHCQLGKAWVSAQAAVTA